MQHSEQISQQYTFRTIQNHAQEISNFYYSKVIKVLNHYSEAIFAIMQKNQDENKTHTQFHCINDL